MPRLIVIQCIAGVIGAIIAAKKGRSILIWSLLCFIFPFFTIVISVLPSLQQQTVGKRCPSCSRPISPHETACRHCSRSTPIELVKCSRCGSYIPEHEKCPACDQKK
jgi:RNA polymerase subunit RPABC4/transcription elongation factor Spt4